jgi:hypothetical protein
LPSFASSIIFRLSFSASPATSCSTKRVVLFFDPSGRPGFPAWKGRPRIFRVCAYASAPRSIADPAAGFGNYGPPLIRGKRLFFKREFRDFDQTEIRRLESYMSRALIIVIIQFVTAG